MHCSSRSFRFLRAHVNRTRRIAQKGNPPGPPADPRAAITLGRARARPAAHAQQQGNLWAWCQSGEQKSWPICDPTAAIDARAADIVSRLTTDDKINALVTNNYFANSLDLPPYNWWSEATHGISRVNNSNPTPFASNTALPITTSCSFNRSLWHATGNQIGREARAFGNVAHAYNTFWTCVDSMIAGRRQRGVDRGRGRPIARPSAQHHTDPLPTPATDPQRPVINIVRDPRWGRNIESAGEDPFVSGAYARDFVIGFEHASETGDSGYPLQASACCKHFVANELDGWNGTVRALSGRARAGAAPDHNLRDPHHTPLQLLQDRNHIDSYVPQQDLVDSYLPSFQTCVEEGKVSGIMVS